ncbi:MAG: YidC/Oxa1 family membrane protein insertase [Patescibacteria group bacterium]|jgi:YidC/Oxa1 family membrane protein insertase
MGEIFNTVLYEPIFNALFYLYHVIPGKDLGVSIILLTLIIKFILFWPSLSALKAQKSLQDTQPKLDEIKKKYKNDKEEMGRQLIKFYKENKVNPFSSCLPLLIQLPILIALYRVFLQGLQVDSTTHLLAGAQLDHLYPYLKAIYETSPVHTTFLGFLDLTKTHNVYLAVIAGIAQFFSGKMLSTQKAPVKTAGAKDENIAATMNKQMMYMMPIFTVIIGYQFPAGVALYWLVTTLFTLLQQLYFLRWKKAAKESSNEIKPQTTN